MLSLEKLDIPKTKINQFKKKDITSIYELVNFFPKKYIDFRYPILISQAKDGDMQSIIIKIKSIYPDYRKNYVRVIGIDSIGTKLSIMYFNSTYMVEQLAVNTDYIVCGKISINYKFNNQVQMINPMYISTNIEKYKKIIPVYSKIRGMSEKYLNDCIDKALDLLQLEDIEYLESSILKSFNICDKKTTLINAHKPINIKDIKTVKKRIIFDNLFQEQFQLEAKDRKVKSQTEIKINKFEEYNKFIEKLPFELTKDQSIAMETMCNKMQNRKRINTLLTADVGAGKTVIAFLLMIILAENGYQGALMAPTSVLAKQHYNELKELLKDTPFKVCFLNGSLKVREKRKVLKGIKNGEYNMIVGTHAVIQKDVEFNNLGIAIVDEEHRFGVAQRAALIEKTKDIHYLTMSATPIPRSLALTIYGNAIDILTIKTMPNGRKPVKTTLINNKKIAYQFMLKEIEKGHQCYFVCPLIEKSDSELMANIDAVEDIYKEMGYYFKDRSLKISMVTGKMKEEDVEKEINNFKNNETQIMVATTVIEVGVNIPNSTVIVINNAERFGLAQLHQIRGRVGRSDLQSYCLLVSQANSERLHVMTTTNNGFKIAMEDLQLRGSGKLTGTEQSGENEFINFITQYPNLFSKIKKEIKEIYDNKERLKNYKDMFTS